jgi:hypothetical protein
MMNVTQKAIFYSFLLVVVHLSARVQGSDYLLDYVHNLTRRFQDTWRLDHVYPTDHRLQVVGGGSDNDELNDMDVICQAVEQSFKDTSSPVDCKCLGSVTGSFTISCDYNDVICSRYVQSIYVKLYHSAESCIHSPHSKTWHFWLK